MGSCFVPRNHEDEDIPYAYGYRIISAYKSASKLGDLTDQLVRCQLFVRVVSF